MLDRHLDPAFAPQYGRIDITQEPNGSRTVSVYYADGPGFVRADQRRSYEHLTVLEALDVVEAEAAVLLGT